MVKTFKNLEIYNLIRAYEKILTEFNVLYLPVKINFYFNQNIKQLICKALEIEKYRNDIIKKYSINQNDESLDKANEEIKELMSLEQELDIKLIPLSAFDNIQITPKMMEIFMPMISEEE